MEKNIKEVVITSRSVLGALASCAVRQSPYHRPDNLEVVLDKFFELIKEEINETTEKYIKKFDSWKECHDWIADKLNTIPEFLLWNERKNGGKSQYAVVSRFNDIDPDNDFIDLDALTRNITNIAIES